MLSWLLADASIEMFEDKTQAEELQVAFARASAAAVLSPVAIAAVAVVLVAAVVVAAVGVAAIVAAVGIFAPLADDCATVAIADFEEQIESAAVETIEEDEETHIFLADVYYHFPIVRSVASSEADVD